jgi:hypothetical protein
MELSQPFKLEYRVHVLLQACGRRCIKFRIDLRAFASESNELRTGTRKITVCITARTLLCLPLV